MARRLGSVLLFALLIWAAPGGDAAGSPPRATAERAPAERPKTFRAPWRKRARVAMKVTRQLEPGGDGQLQLFTLPGLTHRQMREMGLRPPGQGLTRLDQYPPEPAAPAVWDAARFNTALGGLCPVFVSPDQIKQYAGWILRYSMAYGVDPSLVAALIYQQSRCVAWRQIDYGLGLALINLPMHRANIKDGFYSFMVREKGRWTRRSQVINRFPLTRRALLDPEANIYFAAGLLGVFQHQCPAMDRLTVSAPHRSPVAHFIWGDRVVDAGVEDRILRDRRRLLTLYHGKLEPARGRHKALPLGCPLYGCPRKATSVVGDDREAGQRKHNGIDVLSDQDEEVRAVAAGKVILSGVDLGDLGLRNLPPSRTGHVPRKLMGPRGLLVKIQHEGGLISEYMHLSAIRVAQGQQVERGQVIGHVGRTGMKESDAHLHLGFVLGARHLDPMKLLGPHMIHPNLTALGRRRQALQEQRRSKRREQRAGKADRLELPSWADEGKGLP